MLWCVACSATACRLSDLLLQDGWHDVVGRVQRPCAQHEHVLWANWPLLHRRLSTAPRASCWHRCQESKVNTRTARLLLEAAWHICLLGSRLDVHAAAAASSCSMLVLSCCCFTAAAADWTAAAADCWRLPAAGQLKVLTAGGIG